MGIPQELQDISQWTHSFSIDDLKRPFHSHYTVNGTLTFERAFNVATKNKLSFGFYTTENDPYILGDIDKLEDPTDLSKLHPEVASMLMTWGLYCEESPSGKGIRFVGRLPASYDKESLHGFIYYTRFPREGGVKKECQINIGRPWQRFTGRELPFSSGRIPVIPLEKWETVFAIKHKIDVLPVEETEQGVQHSTPSKLPSMIEIEKALKNTPLDQSPRLMRAYERVFKESYNHYNYWLRIIMAIHDHATKAGMMMEGLKAAVSWSRTDPVSYKGDEDIIDKWRSLSEKPLPVSYHTLLAIAHYNQLQWPTPRPISKKQKEYGIEGRQPMNSEYVNFKAMVDFFGITLYRDAHTSGKMYITGDEDIMKKYFHSIDTTYYYDKYRGIFSERSLANACHIMAQDMGFTGSTLPQTKQHVQSWMFQIRDELDLVKKYFETPFDKLPESYQDNKEFISISTIGYMFDSLHLDFLTEDELKETKLYFKYYRSWLMGFVRNLYWPDEQHMNNCILLLTGREQIRKTSHFKYMLPKFMREERIAFTTHGFSTESAVRDVIKLAAGNSILVWDEIEQYLNAETESNFKKVIDSNTTKIIDKYETIESRFKPIAIYGATSNQKEFKLSDTGSRRLFHIPVKWVDTDRLDKICWWRIVNDLKDEMAAHKGDDPPWLLTKEELDYQSTLHAKITSKSGLEIIIREIWNFNEKCFIPDGTDRIENMNPLKHGQFLSTSRIIEEIKNRSNPHTVIQRAHLVRLLHNLCGTWTGTKNSTRIFKQPTMEIRRGLCTYSHQHERWVMPTMSQIIPD